ncbi:hypothetical protein Taro_012764 [Colocasia esculenta]|uniref:Glutamine amidotransferase domain-containing protein n=1 Tax=Colocasia esculenta TaxID=4460 RepID=A0A843U9P3_COLES|nr:hypothetical protein [Colocasia esculenta]
MASSPAAAAVLCSRRGASPLPSEAPGPPLLSPSSAPRRSRAGARRSVFMSMSTGDASAKPSSPRRFAVLRTGHASDYTERTHGGYGQMLARLLSDGGDETWDIFSVVDGDFSFLDSGYYDGYVLTGSAADAHATDVDWINRLSDALVLLHRRRKKLLGICFGHQILARALGGRTGRAEVGWELGVKTLHVVSDQVSQLYGLALPSALNGMESHQDQVSMVPPGAVVLASSDKTKIEMFALGDYVLGMQCHPEFSEDVLIDIIQSRLSRKVIEDGVAKEAIESFEKRKPDNDLLRALCKAFLKGRRA